MAQTAFPSTYRVGIDLGTTNCVVSYIQVSNDSNVNAPELLPIPQVMADGSVQWVTKGVDLTLYRNTCTRAGGETETIEF